MKTKMSLWILLLFLTVSSAMQAQTGGKAPRLRERISHAKLAEIGKSLYLDKPTFDRLKPVYLAYEHELSGINLRELGNIQRADPDSLTAGEADRLIRMQLENAKKMIAIREKYYSEFKKVLTPQQIIKLYQTEAEIRRKVMQEFRRRFGNRYN
jgi:hypothetical protein